MALPWCFELNGTGCYPRDPASAAADSGSFLAAARHHLQRRVDRWPGRTLVALPTLTSPLLRGAVTQACAARVRRCHRARTGRRDAECTTIHELCRGGSVVVEDVRWCLGGHGAAIGSVHHGISDNVTFRRLLLTAGITQAIDCGGGCRIKS